MLGRIIAGGWCVTLVTVPSEKPILVWPALVLLRKSKVKAAGLGA